MDTSAKSNESKPNCKVWIRSKADPTYGPKPASVVPVRRLPREVWLASELTENAGFRKCGNLYEREDERAKG